MVGREDACFGYRIKIHRGKLDLLFVWIWDV